jgi:hypothetical protein
MSAYRRKIQEIAAKLPSMAHTENGEVKMIRRSVIGWRLIESGRHTYKTGKKIPAPRDTGTIMEGAIYDVNAEVDEVKPIEPEKMYTVNVEDLLDHEKEMIDRYQKGGWEAVDKYCSAIMLVFKAEKSKASQR